jgi:hypothetical protein
MILGKRSHMAFLRFRQKTLCNPLPRRLKWSRFARKRRSPTLSKGCGDRHSPSEIRDLNQDRPHQPSTKETPLLRYFDVILRLGYSIQSKLFANFRVIQSLAIICSAFPIFS